MPNNTDARRKRKKDTITGTAVIAGWMVLGAAALLVIRHRFVPEGLWSTVVLIAALLNLGTLVPIFIQLKNRLREIEGGEEDAAAEY